MAKNTNQEELISKGKRKGRKELKDYLILNLRKDIEWIGDKREEELLKYIQDVYMKLTYGGK